MTLTGCLESIVHYKILLYTHLAGSGISAGVMEKECRGLLQRLEELDPMRRQRYRDLGASQQMFIANDYSSPSQLAMCFHNLDAQRFGGYKDQ